MVETLLTIPDATLARLQEMASWSNTTVDAVLEQAIEAHYNAKFWDAVNAGYAGLRADPTAWAQFEADRKLWDNTTLDGLDPTERWTDDGIASRAAPRECAS